MIKWLTANATYPAEARDNNIQGTVVAQFVVEKDGSISNIEIIASTHDLLDAEAIRVLKLMPKWIPAKRDGKVCRCFFAMPLSFALDDDSGKHTKHKKDKTKRK